MILGLTGSEAWRGKGDWFPGGRGGFPQKGAGGKGGKAAWARRVGSGSLLLVCLESSE